MTQLARRARVGAAPRQLRHRPLGSAAAADYSADGTARRVMNTRLLFAAV